MTIEELAESFARQSISTEIFYDPELGETLYTVCLVDKNGNPLMVDSCVNEEHMLICQKNIQDKFEVMIEELLIEFRGE